MDSGHSSKRRKAPEGSVAACVAACSSVVPNEAQAANEHGGKERLLNPVSPLPSPHFNAALQQCVYPHICSYNTFADCYVDEMVKELPFVYVDPSFELDCHEANPYYKPTDCAPVLCWFYTRLH